MKNFTQKILGFFAFLLLTVSLSAQTPFWTEDFDGGLPDDWTALEAVGNGMNASNWMWTTDGASGPVASIIPDLNSTTSDNGWMIFDSDLNCSGAQNVWLIMPKLDLNDKDAIYLRFENLYREFNSLARIQVSTDSMIWTQIPLFAGVGNTQFGDGSSDENTTANPQTITLDLTANAAGESEVWIAFEYLADSTTVEAGTDIGCGYAWQIDDVALLDTDPTPPIDLSLIDYFYPPLSYATPTSQIAWDTMGFSGNVSNIGTADVTNVVLKATVTSGGSVLFADSIIADVIPAGTVDTLLIVPSLYPPSTDIGTYTIDYVLYSLDGDDANMNDNVSPSRNYVVTDDLWSKDDGTETNAFNVGGDNFFVANAYWTSPDWVEPFYALTAEFVAAANGTLSNFSTTIVLCEINEDEVDQNWGNFDTSQDFFTNTDQLTIRSFVPHDFVGGNFSLQTSEFEDFDTFEPGVLLKEGNRYFLIASYSGESASGAFHGFDESTSHDAIASTVFIEGDQWYLGGFQGNPAAMLRMIIGLNVDVEDKLSPEVVANIYPNPVSDYFNLELNFEKPELTNVTIANLDGRVISVDVFEKCTAGKQTI